MGQARYKNLIAWQKAHLLAKEVYLRTKSFPTDERFGITSQLRRAALSIPTNIVEGCSRKGSLDFRRFVNISMASLSEVEYLIQFSVELGFLNESECKTLFDLQDETGKLLWGLFSSMN